MFLYIDPYGIKALKYAMFSSFANGRFNSIELLINMNSFGFIREAFTTDPFMFQYQEIIDMSVAAIRKLNESGIKCSVLTKGILPIELAGLSKENEYGITLVSLSEDFRERMEPGSAPLCERIKALRALHDAGCKTWVSIEPYPTPNMVDQDLMEILEAVSFVDKIIFGRMNYCKEVTAYNNNKQFFNSCAIETVRFCKMHEISYHVKDGTITE